jgi:hypothetical protein
MSVVHNHDSSVATAGNLSNATQGSLNFQQHYGLISQFDLNCGICCATFLLVGRQYQIATGQRIVAFGLTPDTKCGLDGPRGPNGVHGLVVTGHDKTLGQAVGARPVQSSHSYQFYNNNPNGLLALGAQLIARIEAIAVTQINTSRKLSLSYFDCCDAALLELYRLQTGRASLQGYVCIPTTEDAAGMDALTESFNSMSIEQTQTDETKDDRNSD